MAAGPQRAGSTPSSDHYNRKSTITGVFDISTCRLVRVPQMTPDGNKSNLVNTCLKKSDL